MTKGNDELGALGYVSSAPDFNLKPVVDTNPKDLENLDTLDHVRRLLANRKEYYQSVDSLSLEDKTFTVEEQLAINKRVLFHIQELEGLVEGTIKRVKETLKYGRE